VPGFAQAADGLEPAKGFFHPLPALAAHRVPFAPRGPAVHGAAGFLAGHMGLDAPFEQARHELVLGIGFVGPDRGTFRDRAFDHPFGGFDFGRAAFVKAIVVHPYAASSNRVPSLESSLTGLSHTSPIGSQL
jgi:hypothetical protein